MPVSAVVAGIASLSISGMPPTSGFSSKWTIISSSLLAGDGTVALVLFGIIALFTSAVTLACYVKFFGMAFTSSGSEWNVRKTIREVPASMLAPKLVLTAVALVQGLFPVLFDRARPGRPADGPRASSSPTTLGRRPAAPCRASAGGVRLAVFGGRTFAAAAAPLVVLLLLGLGLALGALLPKVGRREGGRGADLALRLPGPERRQPVRRPEHVRGPAGPLQVRRREKRQVGRFAWTPSPE